MMATLRPPKLLPVCTENRLFLPEGIPALPDHVAEDLREWLEFHGLDDKRIPMKSSILRNPGGWLVWEELNTSKRAKQLPAGTQVTGTIDGPQFHVKCQAPIHPLPFPVSVREHVEDVRAAARAADARATADRAVAEADAAIAHLEARQPLGLVDIPDGA